MSRRTASVGLLVLMSAFGSAAPGAADDLASGFQGPPDSAKPRVYWWWLNSLVSRDGITRDLEEFKDKGIAGVLLFDAGGPAGPMPAGPAFLGPEWRALVLHALREADRLGIEVSVNLCSGWDAGGPWIVPEQASKKRIHAKETLAGPKKYAGPLPAFPGNASTCRDVAVQAFRTPAEGGAVDPAQVVDLTKNIQADGRLDWDVPEGEWTVLRTAWTVTGRPVSCSSPGGKGLELDWMSRSAMDLHFRSMAEVLLRDAGPLAGRTLKYFHDDSWEVGNPNWSDDFLSDFKRFRGYDPRPYLPALEGFSVLHEEASARFLYDYHRTLADCIADNHYARFAALAHARGVLIHCEAGGPCAPRFNWMDALKNLGRSGSCGRRRGARGSTRRRGRRATRSRST